MIIKSPTRTEKSLQTIEKDNTIRFVVDNNATKDDIKNEVEKIFNVKVADVRTLIGQKGKKHAFVKLDKKFSADEVAAKLKMIT